MRENHSPWLYQLGRTRPETLIERNVDTDILIVGGGIAGISTLYFLLKYTDRKICLLEAKRVAHGATGHNAGYVAAVFEKPFQELAQEHGYDIALASVRDIKNSWKLFDELVEVAGDDVPDQKVVGLGGYLSYDSFLRDVRDVYLEEIPLSGPIFIDAKSDWVERLPKELLSLCTHATGEEIRAKLNTTHTGYKGIIPETVAITNSALLTDNVLLHCIKEHPGRVEVFEQSPVHHIDLYKDEGKAFAKNHYVSFKEVILATNGAENFSIKNHTGNDIDKKFHQNVTGVIGYMSGYITSEDIEPAGRYMYTDMELSNDDLGVEPYFYLTRREFKTDSHTQLISVGGPELALPDMTEYHKEHDVPDERYAPIDLFMKTQTVPKTFEKKFRWHGLMGYTKSGVRLVGREPENPSLLYNLGCNGIGILTSVYGGERIARIVAGEMLPPSIFDPKREA